MNSVTRSYTMQNNISEWLLGVFALWYLVYLTKVLPTCVDTGLRWEGCDASPEPHPVSCSYNHLCSRCAHQSQENVHDNFAQGFELGKD